MPGELLQALQVGRLDADAFWMKILVLRREGSCVSCGASLSIGDRAGWDSVAKTVTCASCLESAAPASATGRHATPRPSAVASDHGTAGRSVTREAEKRSERHRLHQEERIAADRAWRTEVKAAHPFTGRIAAAVTPKVQAQPAPSHVQAWVKGAQGEQKGAQGEQKVGEALDAISGIIILHDRHKPPSHSNIDHIAVTPNGVWVIDAKDRPGKRLRFRNAGGLFSRDERLLVGGRDETRLVSNMGWQVQTVREACAHTLGDAVVWPTLCFVDATVGWFERPWTVRGVTVCWRATLPSLLLRPGPLDERRMTQIAERIAAELPHS